MISAVDSSILLDVLTDDVAHADSSERLLRRGSDEGRLIVSECVVAEVLPALGTAARMKEFMSDWALDFVPTSAEAALLAGETFAAYLRRGGSARRVLPDFVIGAHARVHAERLLARDRGYLRDYFRGMTVLDQ